MKKSGSSAIIVFIFICVLALGGYIAYYKFFNKSDDISFNHDEEVNLLDSKLKEVGSSLGWMAISSSFDNQNSGDTLTPKKGVNLLKEISDKQQFTMEYILTFKDNYDKFVVLSGFNNEVIEDASPVSDATIAYLKYDEFNKYYKELFGEDFDNSKASKGNTSYDKDYVYYFNRRSGANGLYVPSINVIDVSYDNGEYISNVKLTYSTTAAERIGVKETNATIKYTKNEDNNIIINYFALD